MAPLAEVVAAEWQRGYPLEELKELSATFKEHDRGLILAAFTGVNERACASWLAEGKLRGGGGAVAVVQRQSRRVPVKDFTGEAVCYQEAGDLVVKRLGYRPEAQQAALELLAGIRGAAEGSLFWLESFVEHEGDALIRRELGLYHICTKIPASSELIGVYCSSSYGGELLGALPDMALERAPEEDMALVRLPLSFSPAPYAELLPTGAKAYADHYSSKNKGESWAALALRGYSPDPRFIAKPAEMSKKWKAENPAMLDYELLDTPLREQLRGLEPLIGLLPGEKHRIRLMRLAPGGGELQRHADNTDPDAGVADGKLLRVHMPIVTNPEVIFEAWSPDGRKAEAHMEAGSVWVLDTRKPHTAVNGGPSERIHLVIDAESGPELRALMREGEEA